MITRPELIFADEPTGNLDSRSATEMLEMTRAAVDGFGQTVVMLTGGGLIWAGRGKQVVVPDTVPEAFHPEPEVITDFSKV